MYTIREFHFSFSQCGSFMLPQPLYTPQNCSAAYQLCWSLALFPVGKTPPAEVWLEPLRAVTERDQVRILECDDRSEEGLLLLVSTLPQVSPPDIVKSVKGRLLHLLRPITKVQFRRNFSLTSVGSVKLETVEKYVETQLAHHQLAAQRSQILMKEFSISRSNVDLAEPVLSSHGRYVTAVHLVLVHAERWRIVDREFHSKTCGAIDAVANRKEYRLSRFSILPDHLHLVLGITYRDSPEQVALSFMNNIAYTHGMERLWMNSYYVGTVGSYDLSAVRRRLGVQPVS